MKKIFLFLILTSLLFPHQNTFAASKPTVSLSDAIIADLALRNYLDYISIYYQDKKTPTTVSLNPSKQWIPASTIKLYVALYAFDQIAQKNISPDDTVTIDDKNVVPTEMETDEFPVLTSGLTINVDTLLKKMITQSDNTAYNTLLDLLDRQKVTAYVQSIGLTHTIVGSKLNLDDDQTQFEFTIPGYNINTTTAQDYAKAYDLLDKDKLPLSKSLLNILAHQKINSMLPAYLPTNLMIAHKTGDLDPLYHDGGIVIGNNHHYILTIYSNLGNPNILAHISELIYTRNFTLVGSMIPDKNDAAKPLGQQAVDPFLLQKVTKNVLGITTPISIPLPDITATDLGISEKDVSLAIPSSDLSYPALPAVLNTLWYGVQKSVVPGEKAREQVDLLYVKSELGRVLSLIKQKKSQEVIQTISHISDVLKQVATDKIFPPDQLTQLAIKSLSDTQFSLMNQQLQTTKDETARAIFIHTIAQTARTQISDIEPHLGEAKAAITLSQKPLLGQIISATLDHLVMQTSGGQQITIPITNNTKVKNNDKSSGEPSDFRVGTTIAVLGSIEGKTVLPSLILNNIPAEIAAPHPVVVEKVNQKNKTIVVSDNGNLLQVNLTPQTTIKAKDTNLQLSSLKQGNVIIVHGDIIEPATSEIRENSTPNSQKTIPTISLSPSAKTQDTGYTPIPSFSVTPTNVPSALMHQESNTQDKSPEVIQATSIQVVQQENTKSTNQTFPASTPSHQEDIHQNTPQPDNKPQQQTEIHSAQPTQNPSSQNRKGNGK